MSRTADRLCAALLCAVPVFLTLCILCGFRSAAVLGLLVVVAAILPLFLRFEHKRPQARDILPIVILTAVAVVGRILFAPLPNFLPTSAILIVGALCFGKETGFLAGALTALLSNLYFGQGLFTPWQMYAWGAMGYVAGALAQKPLFQKNLPVYVFGVLASLVYGLLLDCYTVVSFLQPITLAGALAIFVAGLPFSLLHAASTLLFLVCILKPWRKKLLRIRAKYNLL